jgi:2,3-diketo-5-methylthio-1-phosphopentane phosphatase
MKGFNPSYLFDQAAVDWRIICDFDGTITPFDVTDAILEEFAAKEWEDLEQEWLLGKITARRCMELQIGLMDVPIRKLDAFLDTIPITGGFTDFVAFCRHNGLALLIVSDGMDYAIKRILTRHKLNNLPVIANRLLRCGETGYKLAFPYGAEGCKSGVCKCAVAQSGGDQVLLIGDGRSDCCLAGIASFILAKQGLELHRHCEQNQYPHRPYDDFFDIRALFEDAPQMGRSPVQGDIYCYEH